SADDAGRQGDVLAVAGQLDGVTELARYPWPGRTGIGDVGDGAGLRGPAGADLDLLAGRQAAGVAEVQGGVARAGRGGQPGVGQAEQVEAVTRQPGPRRDGHGREDGLLGRVLGQGPVRQVDGRVSGVVELDEAVGRVGGGPGAELVDLDRADVAHLLGGGGELPPAVPRV